MYAEHCCYYLIHTALVCIATYEYTFNPADGLLHDHFNPTDCLHFLVRATLATGNSS